MSLTGTCTNHGFDSFALAPLEFTVQVDTELQEPGNLAYRNQSSLSYFQLPDQNYLALSLSQLHDGSREPASSAVWTAPDSLTTPGYMACTMTGPGEVFESPALIPYINADKTLHVNSQMIQEFDGRELAVPHDENLYSAQRAQSLEGDSTVKAPPSKARLSCQYPRCPQTFPRKWELQRHTKLKHEKSEDYHCCVYGCNRMSKPIGRHDKFREHWMKHHKRAERLICVFEDCRRGPFMLGQFKEHIQDQHAALTQQENHLNEILKSLELRRLPSTPGSTWLGSLLDCPLAFLGCAFTAHDDSYYTMSDHVQTHDIVERSLGYDAIKAAHTISPTNGVAHCPICQKRWDAKSTSNGDMLSHVAAHTTESRSPHLKELYNMFQPYLLKKEVLSFYDFGHRRSLAIVQLEVEEAGLMPASTTPTND